MPYFNDKVTIALRKHILNRAITLIFLKRQYFPPMRRDSNGKFASSVN